MYCVAAAQNVLRYFFAAMDGRATTAMSACLARIYSNPARVIARPESLRNSAVSKPCGWTASQVLTASVVSRHNGRTRSRRPLLMT